MEDNFILSQDNPLNACNLKSNNIKISNKDKKV